MNGLYGLSRSGLRQLWLFALPGVALAWAAVGLASSASAQESFPTRPITLVVSFGAGGSTDVIARALAEQMKPILGQPVVVETRPGASGNVGAQYVSRQAPDGYTLLVATGSHAAAARLSSAKHDMVADFTPIRQFVSSPYVLVTRKSLGFKDVPSLVAHAKQNPGRLTIASSGFGASPHLAGVLFQQLTGIDLKHVPFNGDTQVTTALLGEHVDLAMVAVSNTRAMIEEGTLVALGITDVRRTESLQGVPTLQEAGVLGYDLTSWFGLTGPRGLDAEVVRKLDGAVAAALQTPELQKRLRDLGFSVASRSSAEFGAFIKSEVERYAAIADRAGLKAE
jgi:tripartite-type tricarboxylate transporter receptor subunit TctC